MSLMMSVCCCGDSGCSCATPLCYTYYIIYFQESYGACGDNTCLDNVTFYYSGLHIETSCTPPDASTILASYKAGSQPFCPAESVTPCGTNSVTTTYTSCVQIVSLTQPVCNTTYSYPSSGFWTTRYLPPTANDDNAGDFTLAFNLSHGFFYKSVGYASGCGPDSDNSTDVLTVNLTGCWTGEPAGCCP